MDKKSLLYTLKYLPYLLVKDNVVLEAGYSFYDLTGLAKNSILNKSTQGVLFDLFKSPVEITELQNTDGKQDFYIFTANNQVKIINILIEEGFIPGETILIFLEKPNSRFEERYLFLGKLCYDNQFGVAVFKAGDSTLLKANGKFLSLIMQSPDCLEKILGRPVGEIIKGWDGSRLEGAWRESLEADRTVFIRELKLESSGDESAYLDAIITPVFEEGSLTYMVLNLIEVTDRVLERKRLEEENKVLLMQKEEIEKLMRTKDEFFSFISHEFRTPLTVINAAVQAMEHICRDEMTLKTRKYVNQIKQNSLRQLRLVNNLLDATRAENGYLKTHIRNLDIIELTRSITESVSLYAKGKGVDLRFKSPLPRRVVAMDEEKYERILLNLLSNAIKFTPTGKAIIVRVFSKNKKIFLEVRDEGIGIPPEMHTLIFDRFGQVDSNQSRRTEGTGIGLSLVKLMVTALGGEIELRSVEGGGSTFTIMFPALKAEENCDMENPPNKDDSRIIRAIDIEFSDIYLTNT